VKILSKRSWRKRKQKRGAYHEKKQQRRVEVLRKGVRGSCHNKRTIQKIKGENYGNRQKTRGINRKVG